MKLAPGGGLALTALPAALCPPSLCNAPRDAYVAAMAIFPRPVSPKNAVSDLRDMFAPDRPHRWSILALSMALTGILLWGFVLDSRKPPKEREIFYVENWMADRKDSDIIRQQLKDVALYETALSKKKQEFQKVADGLGIEWREEEARNTAQRKAIIAMIEKRLNQRLSDALKKEAASGGARTSDTQAAP